MIVERCKANGCQVEHPSDGRIAVLLTEIERLRAGLRHIAETCIQEPDVAQFALRLIDGSAGVGGATSEGQPARTPT